MRKFLFVLFLCVGVVLTSCTEDESSPVGDVYGIISDTKSGAPIRNAEVVISPSNASTVSGSDGHFEFKSLTPGQYKISVTANGYASNSRQVTVAAGQRISCDIHLTPQNNDVVMIKPTSLDFGTNELQLAATITNESDSETEWFLDLGNTPWLYAYPTTGRIGGGKTHSIVFTANRARMKEDKSSVVNISAFGDTHPLSLKCKQSVQLSSVMVVESLNVDFGEEATEQIIRIRNISETDVNWTLWGNDSGYLTMSATHGIVAPGGSQIVTISLNREELNEVLATTFKISDGTVDQPVNVIAYPTPEEETSVHKIFYTSTDGNIVEPYNPAAFGANIVSNECEYGQGVITFDDEVTVIGSKAFFGCKTLATINFPESITEIEFDSFEGCSELVCIVMPNVSYIGPRAFVDCHNLEIIYGQYVTEDNKSLIVDDRLIKVVPAGISSYVVPDYVTVIANGAMLGCASVETIKLHEGITDIGHYAFAGCSNLRSINLPNNMTSIPYQLFQDCTSLESVTIPDGVTAIDTWSFSDCQSLTSVTIPEGVTTIGEGAFMGCTTLARVDCLPTTPPSLGYDDINSRYSQFVSVAEDCKIYVPAGAYDAYVNAEGWADYKHLIVEPESTVQSQIFYTTTNGAIVTPYNTSAFLDADGNALNIVSNTYENGQGVITIDGELSKFGSDAFNECQNLTSIDIPNTVTTIEDCAFFNTGLKSVVIPDSVTSISGTSIFGACYNLTSVTLGSGLTAIGTWMFTSCDSLTDIVIPENITIVGNGAFEGCDNLTSVTLPSKLTSINRSAFRDCSSLTLINIPDSVTSIGEAAFLGCSSLTRVDCLPTTPPSIGTEVFDAVSADCKIYVPDGTYNAYISAEDWVEYKDMIVNPNPTPAVQSQIFYTTTDGAIVEPSSTSAFLDANGNSLNIVSNTYENGQGIITFDGALTSIGERAFYDCSGLTSINIPDAVTSIGSNAFYGCSGLTSIEIPDGVTSIGSGAFDSCSGLTSVNIPDTVTTIEGYTFRGCSGLTSITIPDGTMYIGENAFSGTGLTKVAIPESVNFIGYGAFMACRSLSSINIPSGVTEISGATFHYCDKLTSITIPNSVTVIGDSAFQYSGLMSISIPNSVTTIGAGAFFMVVGLTSVTIPDSVTSIGEGAFARNNIKSFNGKYASEDGRMLIVDGVLNSIASSSVSYSSLIVPDNVTSIGGYAFIASTLYSITIPANVTSIGHAAFADCGHLSSIYCKPLTAPELYESAFNDTSTSLQIYVPTASVDTYKAAEGWSSYADAIVGYEF